MPTDGTLLLEHMPNGKQYLVTALSVFFSFGSLTLGGFFSLGGFSLGVLRFLFRGMVPLTSPARVEESLGAFPEVESIVSTREELAP